MKKVVNHGDQDQSSHSVCSWPLTIPAINRNARSQTIMATINQNERGQPEWPRSPEMTMVKQNGHDHQK